MIYALNLAEDGRILSVTYAEYAPLGAIIVEEIPEGNTYEYRYVDGEYIHDPLPLPIEPIEEATTDEVMNALLGVSV